MSDKPEPGLFGGFKNALGLGKKRTQISEEEIKTLVGDADELQDDEKRMIGEILSLTDASVSEIMTPRVDIMAVEDTETVRQTLERVRGTGFSRLPVYHEDLDTIVGIVHYKDLISVVLDGRLDDLAVDHAFQPLFVPESKDVFPLLSEMQTNRQQMAIVVDEYGGTDGLITIEDIVEEIVGEIIDETDAEASLVTQTSESEWTVDGRLPIEDAQGLGFPVTESDQYETIAGWLMSVVDVVPRIGDEFEVEGFSFKVQSMRRRRIQKLRVVRTAEAASDAETGAAAE